MNKYVVALLRSRNSGPTPYRSLLDHAHIYTSSECARTMSLYAEQAETRTDAV